MHIQQPIPYASPLSHSLVYVMHVRTHARAEKFVEKSLYYKKSLT